LTFGLGVRGKWGKIGAWGHTVDNLQPESLLGHPKALPSAGIPFRASQTANGLAWLGWDGSRVEKTGGRGSKE
jgi:hypothetical protein